MSKEAFAFGTDAVIYPYDDDHVSKCFRDQEAYGVELNAYTILSEHGKHPRIPEYTDLGRTKRGFELMLERGQCLKLRLEGSLLSEKLRWAQEAAEGLVYIHSKGVIHADVACCNLILDKSDHIKVIDFAGASVRGKEARTCYSWYSYRQQDPDISFKTDIFAFGSMLFELECGKEPYHEIAKELQDGQQGRLYTIVENLFNNSQYPEKVYDLYMKDIILRCWNLDYETTSEVYSGLVELGGKIGAHHRV